MGLISKNIDKLPTWAKVTIGIGSLVLLGFYLSSHPDRFWIVVLKIIFSP